MHPRNLQRQLSNATDENTPKIWYIAGLVRNDVQSPYTITTVYSERIGAGRDDRTLIVRDEDSPALMQFFKQKGWNDLTKAYEGQFLIKYRGTKAQAYIDEIVMVGPEPDPAVVPYGERQAWWDQAIKIVCYDWGITDLKKAWQEVFALALVGGTIESHIRHYYTLDSATANLHFYASGNKMKPDGGVYLPGEVEVLTTISDKLDDWFPRPNKPELPDWFAKSIEDQEFALREHIKRELNIDPKTGGAALGQHVTKCFEETLGSPLRYLRKYGPGKALELVKNYCRAALLSPSENVEKPDSRPDTSVDPLRPEIRPIFNELQNLWEKESGDLYEEMLETLGAEASDDEWAYIAETMDRMHGPLWRPLGRLGDKGYLEVWRAEQKHKKENPVAKAIETSEDTIYDEDGEIVEPQREFLKPYYSVSCVLWTKGGRPWTYAVHALTEDDADAMLVALIKNKLAKGFTLDNPTGQAQASTKQESEKKSGWGSKPSGQAQSQQRSAQGQSSNKPKPGDTGTFKVASIEHGRTNNRDFFALYGKTATKPMYTYKTDADLEKLGRGIEASLGADMWEIPIGDRVDCEIEIDWVGSDYWGEHNTVFKNIVDIRAAQ